MTRIKQQKLIYTSIILACMAGMLLLAQMASAQPQRLEGAALKAKLDQIAYIMKHGSYAQKRKALAQGLGVSERELEQQAQELNQFLHGGAAREHHSVQRQQPTTTPITIQYAPAPTEHIEEFKPDIGYGYMLFERALMSVNEQQRIKLLREAVRHGNESARMELMLIENQSR